MMKIRNSNAKRLTEKISLCLNRNEVPDLVMQALVTHTGTSVPTLHNLGKLARHLSMRGNADTTAEVKYLTTIALDYVDEEDLDQPNVSVNILLDCSLYYDSIGVAKRSVELTTSALEIAHRYGLTDFSRRAHSTLGAWYARIGDFNIACGHMKKSLDLANMTGNPLLVMASLANTVVILESLGLIQAALDLALATAKCMPPPSSESAYLHLINANNGIHLSYLQDKPEAAAHFYAIAGANIVPARELVTVVSQAYFYAMQARHELALGHLTSALAHVSELAAIDKSSDNNIRIRAIYLCAEAEVNLVTGHREGQKHSLRVLIELSKLTSHIPTHHEEVLKLIVKLYLTGESKTCKKNALRYFRTLHEFIVAAKHAHFFSQQAEARSKDTCELDFDLKDPYYVIPDWIEQASGEVHGESSLLSGGGRVAVPEVEDLAINLIAQSRSKIERKLRTKTYSVAENWAIAAEFASEGNGLHCFRVGEIAAALAGALQLPLKDCIALKLACRLHDIGKSSLAFSSVERKSLRSLGQYGLICEHTRVGARMLSSSKDYVLTVAARVASTHHEWWNGYGFPCGLKGESIPLEGRICAVADAYASLIGCSGGQEPWAPLQALEQIKCMSGVQLDPYLVAQLQEVICGDQDHRSWEGSWNDAREKNQASLSRNRLFSALGLSH